MQVLSKYSVVELKHDDFLYCYRFGLDDDSRKPRQILVRLDNAIKKIQIMQEKRKFLFSSE